MLKKPPAVIYGALARAWTQCTGLALFALGARELSIPDFGVFALSAAFINIVQSILYSGLYEYTIRSRKEDRLDHTILCLNLLIAILGACVSAAAGIIISKLSHEDRIASLAFAMAPSALLASLAAWHEAQVLRDKKYPIYYGNWIVTETVAALVGAALLFKGFGIYSLVFYRYLQTILALGGYAIFFPVSYLGVFQFSSVRAIFRFALPIYGSRVLATIGNYGADVIVGVTLGPAAAGLYRMGSRVVASASEAISQPLRVFAWVRAGRARASGRRLALAILPVNRVAMLILFPCAAIMVYLTGDLFDLALGARWASAAGIVSILIVAKAIGAPELLLEPLYASLGHGRALVAIRTTSTVLYLLALMVLSRFGPQWAAGASLITALTCVIATYPKLARAASWRRVVATASDGLIAAGLVITPIVAGGFLLRGSTFSPAVQHIGLSTVAGVLVLIFLTSRRSLLRGLAG